MFTSNFILWEMRCVTQLVKLIVLRIKELKVRNSNPDKKHGTIKNHQSKLAYLSELEVVINKRNTCILANI
jgi:hypothetical protein